MVSDQLHRKTYRVDLLWQLPREVEFLQRLAGYNGFPRVKGWDEEAVWMTHCGRSINAEAWTHGGWDYLENQLAVLLFVLDREGIRHRDITANNLLWHPEKGLYLIDFGWSTWADEKDTPTPVPHVMRPWMCEHSDVEQAVETLKLLRGKT